MHLGVISFCDRVGYNVKCPETKDAILRELDMWFGARILQKHWYRIDAHSAPVVVLNPHAICLRSNGNPYYMYLTRHEDVPILFFIDKKVQPGYEKPRIIVCRGRFDESLFSKTLIDGEMVRDRDGKWTFLINDVIAYKGNVLAREALPARLGLAARLLTQEHTPDALLDVCSYQIKRYASCSRAGVGALLDLASRLPYSSRGMYFWPFSQKYKPKLYNFDESLIKSVHHKVKDMPDFREHTGDSTPASPPRAPPTSPDAATSSTADDRATPTRTLWLRKTEQPDVFDVFDGQQQRLGVAQVSSIATSRLLRAAFRNETVAVTKPFECVHDAAFNKWRPIAPAACGGT